MPGNDHHEFAQEYAERRQAAQSQGSRCQEHGGNRHDLEHAAHGGHVARAVLEQHVARHAEHQTFGKAVADNVEEGGKDAQRAAKAKAHGDDAHVFNTAISIAALDVVLRDHAERRYKYGKQTENQQHVLRHSA